MSPISMDKKYHTRDGNEVRIYAVDAGGHFSIHGAVKRDGEWIPLSWTRYGHYRMREVESLSDLIEDLPPEREETLWINIYDPFTIRYYAYRTRREADDNAAHHRTACIPVTIKYRPGDGLEPSR